MDPAKKTRAAAFDQQKFGGGFVGRHRDDLCEVPPASPFQSFAYFPPMAGPSLFRVEGKRWKCDLKTYQCAEDSGRGGETEGDTGGERRRRNGGDAVPSPDGAKAAFIRNYNLWVRDIKTNQETQLTTDGV